MDFGNKYALGGAGYLPSTLAGLSWATIAADLSNPHSTVAQAVDGTANYITAAICGITGNAPASACTSTIQPLESKIGSWPADLARIESGVRPAAARPPEANPG